MPLHLGTLHLKHFQCPTPNPLYSAASANKDLQDPSTGPPSPLQSSLPLVLVQTLQPSPACWTQCSPGFLLLLASRLPTFAPTISTPPLHLYLREPYHPSHSRLEDCFLCEVFSYQHITGLLLRTSLVLIAT